VNAYKQVTPDKRSRNDKVATGAMSPETRGSVSNRESAGLRPSAAAVIRAITTAEGGRLDKQAREDMESRYGADFTSVRVHADAQAAAWADAVGARAFTAGEHIGFGAGAYAPHTTSGSWILAHELAHVLQQRQGTVAGGAGPDGVRVSDPRDPDELAAQTQADLAMTRSHTAATRVRTRRPSAGPVRQTATIQRLIRTPYPWRGVITAAAGANIRSAPAASGASNVLDAIPNGTIVEVLSSSGAWLRVRSRYRGATPVEGYVFNTLVDDAASQKMAASVGTTMVWRPSGPHSGTTFESWASAPTETAFPAVTAATVMNCWEAVMLTAYRAGDISWKWIHQLYTAVPVDAWVTKMSRGPRHQYPAPGPSAAMPQRGDLVFFNGIAHVALATGAGSGVYTFWPPPNTPFTAGGTTDKVKAFTIEVLVKWWTENMHEGPPKVEFAAPAW
jgi:hypothetical protein